MSGEKAKHGTFCWNELATRDTDKCAEFYTGVLGWKTQETDMGDFKYITFKADGKDVGGMMKMTAEWGDIPSHWMSYIAVDDVDETADRVEKLGGRVCVPPTDIPPIGRFAVINDPEGAIISIITLS